LGLYCCRFRHLLLAKGETMKSLLARLLPEKPVDKTVNFAEACKHGFFKCMTCGHIMANDKADSDTSEKVCDKCTSTRVQFNPPTLE
jgi:DNA-directed RNA polymerase subunit RPC12/RpoP